MGTVRCEPIENAGRRVGYPACVRSQISGWRDRGLYPLARVAAEESGAALGWRRRWWGDGAMAAPALSCRVGRERELDRSAQEGYPACVRSQISGWRDQSLSLGAGGSRGISGAALGWRRRWWGDGAMAAPALSCRVGRERELDRSCARVAAEESGAALGWRRRWWGDGAMAAPALSCRVGRERELDRKRAGGLSGVCSLSNFRLARSRSLSLGAGGSRGIWRGLGVAPALVG